MLIYSIFSNHLSKKPKFLFLGRITNTDFNRHVSSLIKFRHQIQVSIYFFKFSYLCLQEIVFTASPDATIRVWGVETAQCGQVIRAHDAPVTGISLHATGDYLLSSSTDMVRHFVTHLYRN